MHKYIIEEFVFLLQVHTHRALKNTPYTKPRNIIIVNHSPNKKCHWSNSAVIHPSITASVPVALNRLLKNLS